MINVGIIGLGFMAVTHLKALEKVKGARIAAICNPSRRHLDGDFSEVFGDIDSDETLELDMSHVKAFRDYGEMLADPDLQLIDICSPTLVHPDQAIRALAAGKHVLLEKPVARTSEDARRIVEATRKSGTFLMPAMCLRFWPEWEYLKNVITDERYGKCLASRFRRVGPPPGWGKTHFHDGAKSGGALLDLHIHDVDFVNHCFGRPKSVFATGYQKFSGAIDHVVAQYQVEGNAIVHAEGGWAMTPGFGFNMSYTANFERATVDYDIARGADELLKVFEEGKDPEVIKMDSNDGYVGEIQYLVDAINAGKTPERVTAEDGQTSIEICEAEEESILQGRSVAL
jgi:predicted dehydrogenase